MSRELLSPGISLRDVDISSSNFYNEIYTSGELSLVSWLWQVSGEAGSGDLARPSWLYEFLKKENAKKNVRPSAAKCVKQMKMDFGWRRLW